MNPGAWMEELTWPEAGERIARGDIAVVPIGARSKEHGHHLPLETDYLLARALCDGLIAALPVLATPVVDFGYYPAFLNYPGSQHLRADTFVALLDDVFDGLVRNGARRIAVVNTGVSTEAPLQVAVRNALIRHGIRVAVADIRQLGKSASHLLEQKFGGHGDEHETSLMLAIAPDKVRMELAQQDYGNMLEVPKTVFWRSVVFGPDPGSGPDYSETGVRGDPTLATREKGEAMLAAMIDDLVEGLKKLGPVL